MCLEFVVSWRDVNRWVQPTICKQCGIDGKPMSSPKGGYRLYCLDCAFIRRDGPEKFAIKVARDAKRQDLKARGVKICTQCTLELPESEFHRFGKDDIYFSATCKACTNKVSTDWRNQNPEKVKEICRKSRLRNIDWIKAYEARPEIKERRRQARKTPEGRLYSLNATVKRNAVKKRAFPKWADEVKIKEIYAECQKINDCTSIEHEVDHIVPLQSDYVCGLHWEGNLQIITGFDNRVKLNRYWPDMPEICADLKKLAKQFKQNTQ